MRKDNFRIDRLQDNTFRITRIDVDGDKHTHVNSRKLANVIINNVVNGKMSLSSRTRTLESMYRLADDGKYREKLKELIDNRKNKLKPKYVNPHKKRF